jgi:uroporphyrinogen-III synthase
LRRVWITRASPGAEATAGRLRALGWDPVVAPILATRILTVSVDLAGVGALAFTSGAGVRAFAHLTDRRDLPVFTVGAATAAATREAGFAKVQSADGDVGALGRLISESRRTFSGVLLHAGALEPAGDLAGELQRSGVPARALPVYETMPAQLSAGFLAGLVSIDAVLVHSPRAGRRLAEILDGVAAPHLSAYGISAEALAALEGIDIGPTIAATLPNEDALLSLLADPPT